MNVSVRRIKSWLLDENKIPETYKDKLLFKKVENVRLVDRFNQRKSCVGTLYLTATHLIFVDPENKKETWILLMHISTVEKLALSTRGAPLQIRCKTFLSVTFVIPKERDCHDIYTTLMQLSQPSYIEDLYCFNYKSPLEDVPRAAGWNFFDLQSEFQRMGLPNEAWCMTNINKNYEVCDTYPRYLYVPSSATTPMIVGSCKFRSKGRLPVLTYLHSNKASISRCSQPLSGFSARCIEDEQLLNCILRANPNSRYMYVVDTRPRINAMANRATGKGYENENFYENIKFHFLGIENIHVMRNSLSKMLETCEVKCPSMSNYLSGLDSSGWLKHIKAILETANLIASAVDDGISVMVHCSDGWDRTAQTCSLASLLLDPYFRTLQGFQALISKEWLAFGHKFTERCGHVVGDEKEVAPIFTQFLDAVWQLTMQFPCAFQFNERFLLVLHDHVYSTQYGTFIGNCEKDRLDLRLSERTFSLWGYMATRMSEFLNPMYHGEDKDTVLRPDLMPQNICLWRGMYARFENGVHPRESIMDLMCATSHHVMSLEDHIKLLSKRITTLKDTLEEKKKSISLENGTMDNRLLESKENLNTVEPSRPKDLPSLLSLTSEQLAAELGSVAITWKTFRNVRECICSTPLNHFSHKYHCWRCGDVFCTRCIDKHIALPGLLSQREVPVCRTCHKHVLRSPSFQDDT